MPVTPDQSQPTLFDAEPAPAGDSAEAAVLRGLKVAQEFMRDPDSYGADWPSAQFNKAYREEVAAMVVIPGPETTKPLTEREIAAKAAEEMHAKHPGPPPTHLDKLIDMRRTRFGS